MRPVVRCRLSSTPTTARCLVVAGLLIALPVAAAAQLTEEEAVQRALARPEVGDLVEGDVEAARGEAVRAGLWPNPVLSIATADAPIAAASSASWSWSMPTAAPSTPSCRRWTSS